MTEKDMIGCLCWFNNYRETVIGILKEIQKAPNGVKHYLDDNGYFYPFCLPVKPDEVKFYNHIGDVNEKDELATKCSQLEKENRELKERLANVSKTIDHISQEGKKVQDA